MEVEYTPYVEHYRRRFGNHPDILQSEVQMAMRLPSGDSCALVASVAWNLPHQASNAELMVQRLLGGQPGEPRHYCKRLTLYVPLVVTLGFGCCLRELPLSDRRQVGLQHSFRYNGSRRGVNRILAHLEADSGDPNVDPVHQHLRTLMSNWNFLLNP